MGQRADDVEGSDALRSSPKAARPIQDDGITASGTGAEQAPAEPWEVNQSEGIATQNQADTFAADLDAEPSVSYPSDDEIAATRADIEQTRAQMSETIDAIQEKLSPEHLKEQARESVKQATVGRATETLGHARRTTAERVSTVIGSARGAGSSASKRVKEKPLGAATLGLSLAVLALVARKMQGRREHTKRVLQARDAASTGEALNWAQRAAGPLVDQVRGAATRIMGREQISEGHDQISATAPDTWRPMLVAPLAVIDLVAGLGLIVALTILRRMRRTG